MLKLTIAISSPPPKTDKEKLQYLARYILMCEDWDKSADSGPLIEFRNRWGVGDDITLKEYLRHYTEQAVEMAKGVS